MQNSISNKPNQLVSLCLFGHFWMRSTQFKRLTFDPVQVAHRAGELDLEVQLLEYASRTSRSSTDLQFGVNIQCNLQMFF